MLNPIFWKKVQGQKHPGRWGIIEHQVPSIKVLFKTNAKSHKHPGMKLLSSESKTRHNQRKQNSYRRAYIYIYIYINTELLGGNKGHQEETHHPTHRFRRQWWSSAYGVIMSRWVKLPSLSPLTWRCSPVWHQEHASRWSSSRRSRHRFLPSPSPGGSPHLMVKYGGINRYPMHHIKMPYDRLNFTKRSYTWKGNLYIPTGLMQVCQPSRQTLCNKSSEILNKIHKFFKSFQNQWENVCKMVSIMLGLKIIRSSKFMGPTWGPPGSCRPQLGPVLAPWTLLSGNTSYVDVILPYLFFKKSEEPQHLTTPSAMMAIRSPKRSASSMKCVERRTVRPSRWDCRMSQAFRLASGSIPEVGSSSTTIWKRTVGHFIMVDITASSFEDSVDRISSTGDRSLNK